MIWDGQYDGIKETHAFFRHMRVPEQCSGEMLIAELQRTFCFSELDDAFIQNTGSKLLKALRQDNDEDAAWLSNFFDVIARYPVSAKQSTKHDIAYVIPLIPTIAMFSSPRRVTKRNADDDRTTDRSWKPGLFVKECLSYCVAKGEIDDLFRAIQESLNISDNEDLFAKFLDEKIRRALKKYLDLDVNSKLIGNSFGDQKDCYMPQSVRDRIEAAPFKRFADDIRAVLAIKPFVSRRQFVAMLESLVRIATSAHVLWLCNINRKLEDAVFRVLKGQSEALTESDLFDALNMPANGVLSYGSNFQIRIREFFKQYERSTKRLCFLLYKVKDISGLPQTTLDWSTPEAFLKSVALIADYVKSHSDFLTEFETEFSAHYMESIKKYSLSVDSQSTHLLRFVLTTLIQNSQPKEVRYARYDQSYFVRHRTHSNRSAVIVSAGAVSLMTLVHCCSYRNGTVLLSNLTDALQNYGITIPAGETMDRFKNQLRELGLTIDSPDAESGMVLQDIVSVCEGGL